MFVKKNDFILIGFILLIALIIFTFRTIVKEEGNLVIVKVDGILKQELPLNQDATVTINGVDGGTNTLTLKDGYAFITEASCPDKLCKKHKRIRYDKESIICLPNKVVIEIKSNKKTDLDAIAN